MRVQLATNNPDLTEDAERKEEKDAGHDAPAVDQHPRDKRHQHVCPRVNKVKKIVVGVGARFGKRCVRDDGLCNLILEHRGHVEAVVRAERLLVAVREGSEVAPWAEGVCGGGRVIE